jgi:hypothetical protein
VVFCLGIAEVLAGITCASPSNLWLGMTLMILGGFTLTLAPMMALGVDVAGRQISGTASGVLDATGSHRMLVLLLLAGSRFLSAGSWPGQSIGNPDKPSLWGMVLCQVYAPGLMRHTGWVALAAGSGAPNAAPAAAWPR